MSNADAPVRTLTIQQWYDLYHDHEGDRCELVRGHATVSYTHLDVYKRQEQFRAPESGSDLAPIAARDELHGLLTLSLIHI